ncbi:uncharacterized protein EDB93DRAFT_1147372 [Suillus bovinus]|uniref:uncharacterized protein n=1 Tax=Suillus bovinus TaxID=48563 RepID=UPI001B872509|nr:uncharacterized protein EDB93DRAFT_1147372 [Suillus bovinus]KAG2147458.1 hypothetical protein EDB93DRAFT_1147372 [Suillus bovinus]
MIYAIAVNSHGTLVASASDDNDVRLWQLSNRRTIAIFRHTGYVLRVTFSTDGKHILSGGKDKRISKWAIPEDALPKSKLFTVNTAIRNAFITGDLFTAESLLTEAIYAEKKTNYISYANRSFLMAQKSEWDCALEDARTSLSIQPSLMGCISKGIALCGQKQIEAAMKAFDLAFIFADEDSKAIHFLLLIKAIALFNANQHEDAMERVQELAAACRGGDTLTCRTVKAYLNVQLGINAFNDARYGEADDHFTTAINTDAFSSKPAVDSTCEDLCVLFGWDIEFLWKTARQKRCYALLRLGKFRAAVDSYNHMMDMSDETMQASCFDWSTAFKDECSTLCVTKGDTAFAAHDYDKAIALYSAAIDLGSGTLVIFLNRCKANTEKRLWEEAVSDAQKVIELEPSSYIGYQLKHAALHGAQRFDEAIDAFKGMLSKLEDASESHVRNLRQHYISPFEAEVDIRGFINPQLENAPLRLLDTTTGLLCDREAQITAFKESSEYNELLLFIMTHPDSRMEHIRAVVEKYFRCVMLSHRWEGKESRLQDIKGKNVYELHPVGGILKLQVFCRTAGDAGYRWAWMDTCCIDQTNNVELSESIDSMFDWYHHAALTIVYLSDVLPSSNSGALGKSVWNERGWTFQELMASKCILFYQKDWTLYLNDCSANHKHSNEITEELAEATGIDRESLASFHPGTRNVRKILQWASSRITTRQEDIAYSLFGVFRVYPGVSYGERKQNALGRLLQAIIAQSGDITALDWVGKPSEFNSCLPAEISSYKTLPPTFPSLSPEELSESVSLLRDTGDVQLASKLYSKLDSLHAPRFAHKRLQLPCIAFRVTEIKRKSRQGQDTRTTYEVKTDRLRDLLITTEDELQLPIRLIRTTEFLLIRPWDHGLLGSDDVHNVGNLTPPESPADVSSVGSSEEHEVDPERALRLIVRLGQPFGAFLLKRELLRKEYKRVASDLNIIAQLKDTTHVHDMEIRTVEIL